MGMTIDKAITHIVDVICVNNTIRHSDLVVFNNEKQALRTAIDTMRKYQQIEQILKDIPYGGEATVRRIQEVVEDGNENKS